MMIAGVSAAQAQNAPTTNISPPPNSINAGNRATMPSGSESQSTAKGRPTQSVTGSGKFCAQSSANVLDCKYASLSECQKASKADSLHCVANPRTGTTGAR
jgi:hypothetical protein